MLRLQVGLFLFGLGVAIIPREGADARRILTRWAISIMMDSQLNLRVGQYGSRCKSGAAPPL